jgi:hypothetical protein
MEGGVGQSGDWRSGMAGDPSGDWRFGGGLPQVNFHRALEIVCFIAVLGHINSILIIQCIYPSVPEPLMFSRRAVWAVVPMVILAASTLAARAGTIAELNNSNDDANLHSFGQSFTTQAGGPFDDLAFNFFVNGNAAANGTAYLFSAAYSGAVSQLSTAAGLIASAPASGGFYTFNPSVTVQGNTKYYLYTNGTIGLDTGGAYLGGEGYQSNGSTFFPLGQNDFRLTGDVAAVPAVPLPSALGLGAGFLPVGLVLMGWRRRKMKGCI